MYNELSEGLAYHRLLKWIENFEAYTDYLPTKDRNAFFKQSLVAFRFEQKKNDLTLYSTSLEKLARLYFFHDIETGDELSEPRSDDVVRKLMKNWMETFADACVKYKVFSEMPKKLTTYFAENPPMPPYGSKDNIAYTLFTAYVMGKLTDCTEAPQEWYAFKESVDTVKGLKVETCEKFYRLGVYYLRQRAMISQHTVLLQGDYGQDEPSPYILCQKGYLVNAGVLPSAKQLNKAGTLFEYISDAPPEENPDTADKAGYIHGYPRFRVTVPQGDSGDPQGTFHSDWYDDGYCTDYDNFYSFVVSGDKKKFIRKGKTVFSVYALNIDKEKQISFADGWQTPAEEDCVDWIQNAESSNQYFFSANREQAICEIARFVTLLELMYSEWENHGKQPFLWHPAKYLILPEKVLQKEKDFREKVQKALDNPKIM